MTFILKSKTRCVYQPGFKPNLTAEPQRPVTSMINTWSEEYFCTRGKMKVLSLVIPKCDVWNYLYEWPRKFRPTGFKVALNFKFQFRFVTYLAKQLCVCLLMELACLIACRLELKYLPLVCSLRIHNIFS